jgi:voltage-gated potassium channel
VPLAGAGTRLAEARRRRERAPGYRAGGLRAVPGIGIARATVLLLLVFLTGVVGYALIENQGLLHAVYTTTVTLSTVGLAADAAHSFSRAGQVFTVLLIWGGVGVVAYLLMQVVGFVVSGELNEVVRARRMEKIISGLKGHVVVCGTGGTGSQALAELLASEEPVVVVSQDAGQLAQLRARKGDFLAVEGPATEADTLARANLGQAKALLACLPTDAENLFLVLTARETAQETGRRLLIVAQAADPAAIEKLRKVGADHVVAPEVIAGTRMASVALRPSALAFLDVMTHSGEEALRLEEVAIPEGSRWAGSTLADVRIPQRTNLLVIGMRRGGKGRFTFNPSGSVRLRSGDTLIVLGTPEQRSKLEAVLAEAGPAATSESSEDA